MIVSALVTHARGQRGHVFGWIEWSAFLGAIVNLVDWLLR